MPITCHFRPDEKLIAFVHVGMIPDDELVASYLEFITDPRFDKSFNLLVDLRQTDSTGRKPTILRGIAGLVQQHYARRDAPPKAAVVAPRDLSFGLARMFEAYNVDSAVEFVTFRTMDAALEWLGVSGELMREIEQGAWPGQHDPAV